MRRCTGRISLGTPLSCELERLRLYMSLNVRRLDPRRLEVSTWYCIAGAHVHAGDAPRVCEVGCQ
jgi:hypothetical protein